MLLQLLVASLLAAPEDWRTRAERTAFAETARYEETLDYCRRLDEASPWIHTTSFGMSPEGRDLILVIASKEGAFTPGAARASGKPIVMIQAGIHAGEISGKDAGLMLLREIAVSRTSESLLDKAIVLFLPIYNVDGHERFGAYNRVNQNGPDEMGWRVTARNLNLNRDFMKADAPETRAWLELFTSWWPDLVIDCHATDGADYQYDLTYIFEAGPNTPAPIAAWMTRAVNDHIVPSLRDAGHLASPYVWFADGTDPLAGVLNSGAWRPMYAHGYTVLQNRPSLVIETHAVKDYGTRVLATLSTLRAFLLEVNRDPGLLRSAVRESEEISSNPGRVPLRFKGNETPREATLMGVTFRQEQSEISGATRIIYEDEPMNWTVNWPVGSVVELSADVPAAYIVPPAWTDVIDVLLAHGIRLQRLTEPHVIDVSEFRLLSPRWDETPFEGRHRVTFDAALHVKQSRSFPAGSIVVRTDQPSSAVVVHLLDPRGPDSFASWGFFDVIFEQKEGVSAHVMERLALEMLESDPSLRPQFEKALEDPEFAASPRRRLGWFHRRSPYWDEHLGLYPVGLITGEVELPLEPVPVGG